MANFENYKVFYYVATNKNITKAAELLYLTQPAVTKSIQRLEDELNIKLFVRSKKGVELTEEGNRLLMRIAPACEDMLNAEAHFSEEISGDYDHISIVSNYYFSNNYMPEIIREIHHEKPDMLINVDCNVNENRTNFLKDSRIHFFINFGEAFSEEETSKYGLKKIILQTIKDYFLVGEPLYYLADAEKSITEIMDYHFIVSGEDPWPKMTYEPIFRSYGKEFKQISASSAQLRLALAEEGSGIIICGLTDEYAEDQDGLRCLKVTDILPKRQLIMYVKEESMHNIAVAFLADKIVDCFNRESNKYQNG